jgi:hypothetical protein
MKFLTGLVVVLLWVFIGIPLLGAMLLISLILLILIFGVFV